MVLLDPTAIPIPVALGQMAPRPRSLAGLRLGLLANTKMFSSELLALVAERLQRDFGVASLTTYAKKTFSIVASGALLDEVAAKSDAVITAIGD
ncbi:MAG: hypothetical protein O3B84_06670 [Chloroflexi bacterium]|nr:hypothetical protein [Chloroflexota bacterium]